MKDGFQVSAAIVPIISARASAPASHSHIGSCCRALRPAAGRVALTSAGAPVATRRKSSVSKRISSPTLAAHDAPTVHERAVARTEILDLQPLGGRQQAGVQARQARRVEAQPTLGAAPHGENAEHRLVAASHLHRYAPQHIARQHRPHRGDTRIVVGRDERVGVDGTVEGRRRPQRGQLRLDSVEIDPVAGAQRDQTRDAMSVDAYRGIRRDIEHDTLLGHVQPAMLRPHSGPVDDDGGMRIRADPVDALAEQDLRMLTTRKHQFHAGPAPPEAHARSLAYNAAHRHITRMPTLLILMIAAAIVFAFWSAGRAAAERAEAVGRDACRAAGVQWLDQSVHATGIRLCRHENGWLGWERTFRFDYSLDGADRHVGRLVLRGDRLIAFSGPVARTPTALH